MPRGKWSTSLLMKGYVYVKLALTLIHLDIYTLAGTAPTCILHVYYLIDFDVLS